MDEDTSRILRMLSKIAKSLGKKLCDLFLRGPRSLTRALSENSGMIYRSVASALYFARRVEECVTVVEKSFNVEKDNKEDKEDKRR